MVGSTGSIGADKQLIINIPSVQNSGTISVNPGAGNSLTITANNGSITGSGTFTAPTMNLTAIGGNIGANAAATTALAVNNGSGSISGGSSGTLVLAVQATQVGGVGGVVNISDALNSIQIDNSSGPSSASASLSLTANGNIYATNANNAAISSPIVNLTATGGNIEADSGGTTALLVNSGGTSGLSLITNGGTVDISDANAEAVTLNASDVTASYTLNANGNVVMAANVGSSTCNSLNITTQGAGSITNAGAGTYALEANSVTLTSTSGNIGAIRVDCTTFAGNTTGNLRVNDLAVSTVTLNASSAGSGSSNTFTFVTESNIVINGNVGAIQQ